MRMLLPLPSIKRIGSVHLHILIRDFIKSAFRYFLNTFQRFRQEPRHSELKSTLYDIERPDLPGKVITRQTDSGAASGSGECLALARCLVPAAQCLALAAQCQLSSISCCYLSLIIVVMLPSSQTDFLRKTYTIPCMIAMASIYSENRSFKWTLRIAGYYVVMALLLSLVVFRVSSLFFEGLCSPK